METLRFERDRNDGHGGAVGRLVLNRPDRLNAFTLEMWDELAALGESLLADPDGLRALVVIGEGRAFSSGIDTTVLTGGALAPEQLGRGASATAGARHADPVVARILQGQASFTWFEDAPFVTIAAVRGFALGAGLQLALACDVRIAAQGARFGLLELRYGIMPDLGGTQRLPRLVGPGRAKEMIFTGRQVEADEAARLGLVEQVVEDGALEETAHFFAEIVAGQPPVAVRNAKRAIRAALDRPRDEGLVVEAEGQAECLRSTDVTEAVTAFVEGRPPRYTGN